MLGRLRIIWLRRRLRHRDDWVREDAVSRLARFRDPADLPAIVALFDDEEGGVADVAQLCAQDFGALAVPHLLRKLEMGEAGSLQALEALGEVGDERALAPLAEAALARDDETDRRWAMEALDRLGLRHPSLRPRVLAALDEVVRDGRGEQDRDLAAHLAGSPAWTRTCGR